MFFRISLVLSFVAAGLLGQDLSSILAGASRQTDRNAKVTALRFNCVPADCKVRPLESLVIQVLVDGEIPVANGDPRKGRLRRTPGQMKVSDKDGGWVSKPFKFQGSDAGGFVESSGSAISSIFQKVAGDYIVQDAFLYTAPEKAGTYKLENDTEGVKAELKVTVDANAPAQTKAEEITFAPENNKAAEPYRAIAEHYAPVLAQETWWQPKSDFPTRFDYDNDLFGDNNWENLEKGTSQAYVYYAAMETPTHWFLIYNAFHPRDYSDKCVAGSCHENDNEGLILTVQKDGSQFGKLLTMETLAHNNVYSYTNDRNIRNGVHDIDAKLDLYENTHPVVFVESGGHGIYGASAKNSSRYNPDKDEFTVGTGVTFVYKGVAERPKHPNDRKVGYELLPILTHWWARTGNDQNQKMFDEFLAYSPFNGRPGIKLPRVGTTFWGRKESSNKAKPFWGWHDTKTLKEKVLAPGQWALDPAYAVSRNLRFPADMQFSLEYTYNPYLGIGDGEQPLSVAGTLVTPSTNASAAPAPQAPTEGTVITAGKPTISAPGNLQPAEKPASILPDLPTSTAPAPTSPETPAAVVVPEVREGWVEVQGVVDASVVFHIRQSEVTAEVLNGQAVRDQKAEFSAPTPSGAGITWSVEKKSGRGTVKIVEQPSDANGQTLKVRVDDSKGGADRHVFRVIWKRQ
jgi:hypothetical protein